MKRNIITLDDLQILKLAEKVQFYSINGFDTMFLVDGTKGKILPMHLISKFRLDNPNYIAITSIDKDNTDINEIVYTLKFTLNKYCLDNEYVGGF